MLDKAIKIAVEVHSGQKTINGEPYILHSLYVMSQMLSTDAKIVGVLHDVVEDTNTTFEDLIDEGFESHIIKALQALYHPSHESYEDYIDRVIQDWLAINVKIEDLKHNMDISRLVGKISQKFINKIFDKYISSYQKLLTERKKFEYV